MTLILAFEKQPTYLCGIMNEKIIPKRDMVLIVY